MSTGIAGDEWHATATGHIFHSVTAPTRLRIAFQGELGAYAESAVQLLFGAACVPAPFPTYRDAINAVSAGEADRVVLPVENTLIGTDGLTHDEVDRVPALHAVAEAVVDVHYALLAPFGATLDTIATVLSHSVALAQCQEFFRTHPRIQTHGLFDTAAAAREVAQLGDPSFAAVASRAAAGRLNLDVVVADIEDRHDNQTRYVAFGLEPAALDAGTPARTMLAFTIVDKPGALLLALQPFATHVVNLRRIDTRPTGEPWSYRFFVDFDHEVGNAHVDAAIAELAKTTVGLRVIGTFRRWKAGRRGSIGWTPTDIPVIA